MVKREKRIENILINLTHDKDLIAALSKLNLRLFYSKESKEMYLAWTVNDYTELQASKTKCLVRLFKLDSTNLIYAEGNGFSVIINLRRHDRDHYVFSNIIYIDSRKQEKYEIKEPKTITPVPNKKLTYKIKNRH